MPQFMVEFRVEGIVSSIFEADTLEDAQKKANAMTVTPDGSDWSELMLELDEVTDANARVSQLHKVRRNGEIRHTNYVLPTDEKVE